MQVVPLGHYPFADFSDLVLSTSNHLIIFTFIQNIILDPTPLICQSYIASSLATLK